MDLIPYENGYLWLLSANCRSQNDSCGVILSQHHEIAIYTKYYIIIYSPPEHRCEQVRFFL